MSHCSATIIHTVIPTADVRKAAPPRPSPSLPRTLLLLLLRQRSDFLKSDQVYAVRLRETPTTADSAPCALLARVQSCIGRWETGEEVKERWGCVETRTHWRGAAGVSAAHWGDIGSRTVSEDSSYLLSGHHVLLRNALCEVLEAPPAPAVSQQADTGF